MAGTGLEDPDQFVGTFKEYNTIAAHGEDNPGLGWNALVKDGQSFQSSG